MESSLRPVPGKMAIMNHEPRLAALRRDAKSLHEQGRLPEALALHEEALRLAPDAVVIWLSAARLAHALEQQEKSLRYFERAASFDPKCFAAIDAARRICIGAGLLERAQRYSRMAFELHPSPDKLIAGKLALPAIAESRASIHATREAYERA